MSVKEKTSEVEALEQERDALLKEIDRLNTEADALALKVTQPTADESYELTPISPGNPVSRYDGIKDGLCLFHESLSFEGYAGYDVSALAAWCKGASMRAFGMDDQGQNIQDETNPCYGRLNDLPVRDPRTGNIVRVPPAGLPPFDKRLCLECIIRILPLE